MPMVVTSCTEGIHSEFHRVSLPDRRFWCVLVEVGKKQEQLINVRAEGGEFLESRDKVISTDSPPSFRTVS